VAIYLVHESESRRVRPRLMAGMIFVLGVIVTVVMQISLGMVLTEDAYKLRQLGVEQRNLATEVQILSEEVDSLSSPQNLADAANQLGMLVNTAPVLLEIQSNRVFGEPKPADPARARVASANLVSNSALSSTSNFAISTIPLTEAGVGVVTQVSGEQGLVLTSGLIPASPTR
jgi:cell division protein FtsL